MKTFISTTITNMFKDFQKKIESSIEEKIGRELDDKLEERVAELSQRMDLLTYENVQLREENDNLKNRIDKNETVAHTALEISNRNEQYSRKNNIKLMGLMRRKMLIKQLNHILDTKEG